MAFDNSEYVAQIEALLSVMGLDTDADPCSGLMVESVEKSEAVVRIFDDHASGEYYADRVVALLKGVASIEWDDPRNVWQVIAPAEV